MRISILATVCAGVLSSTAASAQCPDGTPFPCAQLRRVATVARAVPAPAIRARQFVMLPFRNVTQGAAQQWLVTGAPLMLGEALGRFRDLTVIAEERVTAARRRLALPTDASLDATQLRRLAEETDGWTAVMGNVFASGGRLRLSVQALDIATSRVLVRGEDEIAADADVREAFDRLSVRLLQATGLPASAPGTSVLPTKSVDAYRAYVRGVELTQRSAFRRAEAAFAEAVRLDSTFALAWAKLAFASMLWNAQVALDPSSRAFRAVEQAARYASQLPDRQAQLVRSGQSFLRGQTSRARQLADSLVSSDRGDLDAREMLAIMEMVDPIVDTTVSPNTLAASMNRSMVLAREVLDRDPGRRYLYAIFAYGYGEGGGLWSGGRPGFRREYVSVAAMFLAGPDMFFTPVLRDTLELVVSAEFRRLPAAERARLRRRSADAAMAWVDRWLAAGPADAEAHLWASRIAELRNEFPKALRELVIADSLGVESAMEGLPGRRLVLLVHMKEYNAAGALADSLLKSGSLARKPFNSSIDRGREFGVLALLLSRRWASAAALAVAMGPGTGVGPSCSNLSNQINGYAGDTPEAEVLRATMDTVALHFAEAHDVKLLSRCVEALASSLVYDSTSTRRSAAGAALLAAADSLQRAGLGPVAYRAARSAWYVDTIRRVVMLERNWFVQRSRSLAVGSGFTAGSAILQGDSATFAFSLTNRAPVVLDSPGLATNWSFSIRIVSWAPNDSTTFWLQLSHFAAPTDTGSIGGVPELLGALQAKSAWSISTHSAASNAKVSVATTVEGFRAVLRGPLVAELRRLRPATARFSAYPCIAVTEGLCVEPGLNIVIEYR